MAAIEVVRTVSADPAGVALMLAGPTAAEILADATALGGAGIDVRITPPHRAGIGFAAGLRAVTGGRVVGSGVISIHPAPGEGSRVSVNLRPSAQVNAAALARWLRERLDELVAAARERSFAA